MNDYNTISSADFGKGKSNTEAILNKWKNYEYGQQDDNDIWGKIQIEIEKGWFMPSIEEWLAFANELEITSNNYKNNLPNHCLSSSIYDEWFINIMHFQQGKVTTENTIGTHGSRLATTF